MPRFEAEFLKAISSLVPPPPNTGALDRTYVHNVLRNASYINVQVIKDIKSEPSAAPLLSAARVKKLLAVKEVLYSHVKEHIEGHLAFKCRSLLRAVCDTLPPELREMVYKSIFSGFHIYVEADQLNLVPEGETEPRFPPDFIKSSGYFDSEDLPSARYGHVFKTSHADEFVRRELINTWYRVTTFNFDYDSSSCRRPQHPDYVSQIMHFFKHDRWGTGFDLRELVKSVRITDFSSEIIIDDLLWHRGPVLRLPHSPEPVAKLNSSTKITLHVHNTTCGCPEMSCIDLNTEMRRMFVSLGKIKLLLEHRSTVWIDLFHHLEFEAKMEELNEECWAEKAAAVQARSAITFCCRRR